VPKPAGGWNLSDFDERIDRWISIEAPDVDQRMALRAWLLSRLEDPYRAS
jgi:hypothetical protein